MNAGMNQSEGFSVVRNGLVEMACYAPEPEPSFWRALLDFLTAPRFKP